ncbi:MAG: HD domain-containing protein, partial [Anaeroplasma sp.]
VINLLFSFLYNIYEKCAIIDVILKVGAIVDFQNMLIFVKDKLESSNAIKPSNPYHCFRNRYEHTLRVLKWITRLLPDFPECNKNVVFTSAIFHDVGYYCGKENHAIKSKEIFVEYAYKNNLDKDIVDFVSDIISKHSSKELLNDKNSPIELILLLEADLLDEEGAMGMAWDLMAIGAKGANSYADAYNALLIHSAHILNQNYMVTPIAIKYWNEKKEMVKSFLETLKNDLELCEDIK